ncbi:MAG TPA: PCYCGC motif-containing (lipo)protein [Gemmatimonadales bacterium]|jgi:hypothetical protein|nr:PCYCGC motif-containing (lipo)protein [Gemmatimonadales bacterium]
MSAQSSRREFVFFCSGTILALATGVRRRTPQPASCHHHIRHVTHPEPRPGITAARVLPKEKLTDHPDAITAFEQVRQIPQIVDGIGCHCGCATRAGFYSLLSCYEGEGMAMMCEVCQGQGRLAFRLHQAGKTLDQIRAGIDARYG